MKYASLKKRLIASLIDWLLLILLTPIALGYLTEKVFHISGDGLSVVIFIYILLLLLPISFLYFSLCNYLGNGKTLGKLLLHMRVIDSDKNKKKLTFKKSLLRSLIITLLPALFVPFGIGILGYLILLITVAVDSKRQGLHDRLVGTYVVNG